MSSVDRNWSGIDRILPVNWNFFPLQNGNHGFTTCMVCIFPFFNTNAASIFYGLKLLLQAQLLQPRSLLLRTIRSAASRVNSLVLFPLKASHSSHIFHTNHADVQVVGVLTSLRTSACTNRHRREKHIFVFFVLNTSNRNRVNIFCGYTFRKIFRFVKGMFGKLSHKYIA